MSLFYVGDDLRTNTFHEEGNDGGMAKEWSADPLEIPLGPMTRGRAKRFKETLNVLIRDAQVKEAHKFNSKEETKMVHVIKVNLDFDQEPRRFLLVDLLLLGKITQFPIFHIYERSMNK